MNATVSSDSEKRWLVKSDNKIIGPFSFEELEGHLFQKQISLIDEVRDMNHRWMYIREIPELKDMAEKVRLELDKKSEQTRTVQSGMHTNITSVTRTVTKTEDMPMPELTNVKSAFTNVSVDTQDISFNDIDIKSADTKNKKNIPQFVHSEDPNIKFQLKNEKKYVGLIVATGFAVVLILMGSIYLFKKMNQENNEKALFTQVRKYMIFGADRKASETYQKLPEYLQFKVLPDMISILPRLEAEGVVNIEEALKHIQKSNELTMSQKSQIELIKFHKKIQLNQLSEAKGHLISARDFDPNSELVKENDAILANYEKNYKASAMQFLELFSQYNKGRYLLGYSLNQLMQTGTETSELSEKIERYISTRIDYKKELILIQIILSLKANPSDHVTTKISEFIATPIMLSHKFKMPSLIDQAFYKIDKLYLQFEDLKSQLDLKSAALIDLYLNLEKADGYAAQKKYEQNQSLFSNAEKANAQIAINGFFNRYSEVLAIEKSVENREVLNTASHILLLKLKKENKNSEIRYSAEFLKKEKNLLSFWSELMLINDSETEKMKMYLQLNSRNAEDFIPYIEAKAQLE